MIMKKYFLSLGLIMAAMLTLTNCTEQIDAPVEPAKVPFEIIASTVDTKTTNDGLNTTWAEDDALNIFHAEAGTENYVNDGQFVFNEGEKFTGTLASELTADSYDWYAFYPYTEYITTPANVSAGYTSFGTSVYQKGNDSMSHLIDDKTPMYGIKTGVSSSVSPSVSMKHLTTVLAFNITNNSNKPLVVSTIKLTVPEEVKISGTFYVDFSSDDIVFTEKNGKNYATLYVDNGGEIPVGESTIFYMPVKPFTLSSGSKVTYEINGYAQEVTLNNDVTFGAGKIKTINCEYDKQIVELTHALTSNIAWTVSKDTKSYSEKAIVNGTEDVDVLKLGASSAIGTATITIPAGTTKVGFYGVAWNGKSGTIQACSAMATTPENAEGLFYEKALTSNAGANSSSPYTITVTDSDYYEIVVQDVLGVPAAPEAIPVTLRTVSGKTRVIIWGLNSYTE